MGCLSRATLGAFCQSSFSSHLVNLHIRCHRKHTVPNTLWEKITFKARKIRPRPLQQFVSSFVLILFLSPGDERVKCYEDAQIITFPSPARPIPTAPQAPLRKPTLHISNTKSVYCQGVPAEATRSRKAFCDRSSIFRPRFSGINDPIYGKFGKTT